VETGEQLASYDAPDNSVRSLRFSPDGSRVAAGMELGDVLVWDASATERSE
jgi:hypothetical protein